MSPIVILSGSKLLATCLAASLARIGAPTQAFDQANSAFDALRRLASGIHLLHPKSGRAIDLTPMRRLAESQTSVRCILLTDAEIERVANATAGLPPHCRVSLDADLDHLVTCIREGRSREWGSSTKAWRPSDDVGGEVKLPDGVEMAMPGDHVNIEVELHLPIAMEKQVRFAIREGGKTVGSGVVTEILD